jgi:serine/threonine protein kinase
VCELGKGAYGYVYKCVDSKTREVVAMKKVILDMENEGFPSTSIREISLLREIDHKNVVTYLPPHPDSRTWS